jgi:hypothetical protein
VLLKEQNKELKIENKLLREKVEKLELIVEELQKMVFKKSSKKDKDTSPKIQIKKVRTKESYRRSAPEEKEVTDEQVFNIK